MARVLVIEDNRANLELMVYLLGAFGHETFSATGGADGLETARREHPDLIVCDLQMPDMDGYSVLSSVRKDPNLHATPIVAVTAFAMVGDRERILAVGFDSYLSKPIDPEKFVGSIERCLPHGLEATRRPSRWIADLPLSQEKVAAPTSGALERPVACGESRPVRKAVLLVDDVVSNAQLARSVLEPSGYLVAHCTGIEEALAAARASPPDLIVSDLHLGRESGFDLLRAIATDPALAGVPVVVLSSTIYPERDALTARSLGAASFVARSDGPVLLLSELEACLRAGGVGP